MEHPVRVAFCKILFWKNGGQFTPTGLPDLSDRRRLVKGRCDKAWDCGQCTFLQEWLQHLYSQGWVWGWECDRCLKETEKADREQNIERYIQGFYQAGRKFTTSPDSPDFDPDRPGLEGCTRCGWESSFLQLIIRRPR